jgi:uncharacterized RDD family membrane protein YckC
VNEGLQVATPERVAVELTIAGLGSRAMAYAVDLGLLGAAGLVLYFALSLLISDPLDLALGLSSTARAIALGVVFFGLWIYWRSRGTARPRERGCCAFGW